MLFGSLFSKARAVIPAKAGCNLKIRTQKAATVSRGGFRHLRRAAPQMKPDPLPNPEL
jgi:hypothetical protein